MKFFAGLAALASLAAAAPSGAPTPLDVKLEMAGNSQVKATITNNGKQNLKIFKAGTIFDNTPVEKVNIATAGKAVEFDGVRLRLSTEGLEDADFQKIPAGQSVEVTFDAAQSHDLTSGGKFEMVSNGILQFANEADNKLVGSIPFASNTVTTNVNGPEAAIVRAEVMARHEKRTRVQSDCTGDRLSVTKAALSNCAKLSRAASDVASSGPASKMEEFFKDSSSSVRQQVANVFDKVAQECGSTNGGASTYHCRDISNHCGSRVLAYTVPSQSYMVYCDLYFNDLPALTRSCHRQDQATTNLHECTHLREIAGTNDNGYGYDNIRRLSTQQSLNNADSYAVFANSVYAGC